MNKRLGFGLLEALMALVVFTLVIFYASSMGLESLRRFEVFKTREMQDTQALSTLALIARELQYVLNLPPHFSLHPLGSFEFVALQERGLFEPLWFESCEGNEIRFSSKIPTSQWLRIYFSAEQIQDVKINQLNHNVAILQERILQQCELIFGLSHNSFTLNAKSELRINQNLLLKEVKSLTLTTKGQWSEIKLCLLQGRCYTRMEVFQRRINEN